MDADTRNTSAPQESDDYVWDVFYHRPASLSEWNHVAANVGTLYVLMSPIFFSGGAHFL